VEDAILGAIKESNLMASDSKFINGKCITINELIHYQVKGVCLGMSGVDRDEDKAEITKYIKALLPTVKKPLVR